MESILTASEMREADAETIRRLNGHGLILMEHAAMACTREVVRRFPDATDTPVVVLAGKGNNGGDGMAVARQLSVAGYPVSLWLVGDPSALSPDARDQWDWLAGYPVTRSVLDAQQLEALQQELQQAEVVVDAVLGTGLNRPAAGLAETAIQQIREARGFVLSVDVPSGLGADHGAPIGETVRADLTVTFGRRKPCHVFYPASTFCGETVLSRITIPDDVVAKTQPTLFLTERSDVREMLPVPERNAHKGTFGHVLVIGGQPGRVGAAVLAAHAALRSGSGRVTLHLHRELYPVVGAAVPELMMSLSDTPFAPEILEEIRSGKQAIVVGPGFGRDADARRRLTHVLAGDPIPVVLDADIFHLIDGDEVRAKLSGRPTVLTPHPGELAAMQGCTTREIGEDRLGAARHAAAQTGCVVVLKGFQTLVASPDGRVWINPTGNPGMGTAGSGDVLSGVIGALLGQGLSPLDAARAGVFLHGLAGDLQARKRTERGLIAGDLIQGLPKAFKTLQETP